MMANTTSTLPVRVDASAIYVDLDTPMLHYPQVKTFKQDLFALLNQESCIQPLLINFQKVVNLDSYGLATILSILKYCREMNRLMALTTLNDHANRLLAVTRLSHILPVYENDEAALKALCASRG